MEIAVEKFAVTCFFLIGVSHIVQPRAWAEFFYPPPRERDDRQFHQCVDPFPARGAYRGLSQCLARHSRGADRSGLRMGYEGFYLFRFSAIRVEGDGAITPRPGLVLCRWRYHDCCARRFAFCSHW